MQREYEERFKECVTDLGRRPKYFHLSGGAEYMNTMMMQSGKQLPRSKVTEAIHQRNFSNALKCFYKFKTSIYEIVDEENYKVIYEDEIFSK